jgi:transcriptional regulator with XRE-family HTH domain
MPNFFETRRAELKLTQRQIAETFVPAITPQAVSAWECNVAAPEIELVDQLVKIYRASKPRILEAIHEVTLARRTTVGAG